MGSVVFCMTYIGLTAITAIQGWLSVAVVSYMMRFWGDLIEMIIDTQKKNKSGHVFAYGSLSLLHFNSALIFQEDFCFSKGALHTCVFIAYFFPHTIVNGFNNTVKPFVIEINVKLHKINISEAPQYEMLSMTRKIKSVVVLYD